MSENQKKGINALKCAASSGLISSWNFIASAWWLLKFVGQQKLLEDQLDTYYPMVCTCEKDVNTFTDLFKFGDDKDKTTVIRTCSEAQDKTKNSQ